MQHHTLVICPVPTGLILSFQYEIVTYLYIEHKITGFTKLPDTGGYGEFFTKKAGYKRVWIWPSGVERGGSQNFAPRRALGVHVRTCRCVPYLTCIRPHTSIYMDCALILLLDIRAELTDSLK